MKKLLILTFALASLLGFGQQMPQYSLYNMTPLAYNPAVAGTADQVAPLTLSYRNQWNGLPEAPITQTLTFDGATNDKVGMGLVLINDMAGPVSQFAAQVAYSYRIQMTANHKLAFGVAPTIYQYRFNLNGLTTDEADDPAMLSANNKSTLADVSGGLHLYNASFFVGLGLQNMAKHKFFQGEPSLQGQLERHYFLSAGMHILHNDIWLIEPSMMLKHTYGAPVQADLSLSFTHDDNVYFGAAIRGSNSKRHGENILAFAGVIHDAFRLGYAYDYSLSSINDYSGGSHEVVFQWRIPLGGGASVSME